jgi:hypothetical protein
MTCARRESLLHPLYPDYEAFVEGRVRVAGLERDDLFAGERIGDPEVLGTDDEVLVGAVVVGSPQGIAEGDEVALLEVLKVAEDVWGTARVVVRRTRLHAVLGFLLRLSLGFRGRSGFFWYRFLEVELGESELFVGRLPGLLACLRGWLGCFLDEGSLCLCGTVSVGRGSDLAS